MNDKNINHAFLDGVLQGKYPDVYYHFGLSSADPVMESLKGVRAIAGRFQATPQIKRRKK